MKTTKKSKPEILSVISGQNSVKAYVLGVKVFEICNPEDCMYKKQKVNFLGLNFSCKSKSLEKKAEKYNLELNKRNLDIRLPEGAKKTVLFAASDFANAGGVETRVLQYSRKLIESGFNVCILSEKNSNEKLSQLTNFYLNFDARNVNECLNEIIEKHNINVVEFQFKNPNFLKNIDLSKLKKRVKTGCVVHNKGIRNKKIINDFDYKIMVSKYMYENFYEQSVQNADIISNSIDTPHYKNLPEWEFKNQKTALLISRMSEDKMKSVECFIKYCKKHSIDFKIAGEQQLSDTVKNKLIKKFGLPQEIFIGQIDTMEYLSKHQSEILFTGGVGLVVLESLYLGYPSFCCCDFERGHYSFVTNSNFKLFDNFTIRDDSVISKLRRKEQFLDMGRLCDYRLREYVQNYRDLSKNFERYKAVVLESG